MFRNAFRQGFNRSILFNKVSNLEFFRWLKNFITDTYSYLSIPEKNYIFLKWNGFIIVLASVKRILESSIFRILQC